jgi:hypothetical protein
MSPRERMYFEGAPVAHVALYFELLKTRRIQARVRAIEARERRRAIRPLSTRRGYTKEDQACN